jgi:membrane protease subunit HflC
MGQVLNEGRATLARDIKPRLQSYLDGYKTGLQITGVNILEALPPKEVKAAFDDVIRAKEDKERLKNQAETYANGIVPEARGQAARVLAEANAYKQEVVDIAQGDAARFNQLVVEYKKSPQVIRQRLYLETMEGVLSKTSKVIIEGNGGNMVYLPLDKIIENSNSTNVTRATPNDMSDTANQRAKYRPSRSWRGALIMNPRTMQALSITLIILSILSSTVYTIRETQRGILVQFGEIIDANLSAGMGLKIPFMHEVKKFDIRTQVTDTERTEYLTQENKFLIVDSYVLWRIIDLKKYFTVTGGDTRKAESLLMARVNDSLKNKVSERTVHEVVAGQRDQMMQQLTQETNTLAKKEFGIEVVDVRVKRVDFPETISESIYNRMRTEREREAREHRSQGNELAETIKAEAEREQKVIMAEAYKQSETLRGEGDALAASIAAASFSKDAEFYRFYRSMQAYKASFNKSSDMMVLKGDSEFLHYMRQSK